MMGSPFGRSGSVVRVPGQVVATAHGLGSEGARLTTGGRRKPVVERVELSQAGLDRLMAGIDSAVASVELVNRDLIEENKRLDGLRESSEARRTRLALVGNWE
jgi:hypothetical protein